MKRAEELVKAIASFHHTGMKESDVKRIFKLCGSTAAEGSKVFNAMNSYFKKYMKDNGLIDICSKEIPIDVAEKYLSLYKITEDRIKREYEDQKKS